MASLRLFSASPRAVLEGLGCWTLRPASPRLFSLCCVDCAKHQESPGKKMLSEKKLELRVCGPLCLCLRGAPDKPLEDDSTCCGKALGSWWKRHFVDHRRVLVRGGRGGDGVTCFHSEPRKEFGGPDGGDGGSGGAVILRADRQVKSLSSVLSRYQGLDGENGGRKNCFGRSGGPLHIRVPVGTLVKEGSEVLADLSHPGDEYIAALGGAGGKGNRFFLANDNRAPTTCTPGQPGQERVLFLELKTVAHAGMWPTSPASSAVHTRTGAWASPSSGISSAAPSSCSWWISRSWSPGRRWTTSSRSWRSTQKACPAGLTPLWQIRSTSLRPGPGCPSCGPAWARGPSLCQQPLARTWRSCCCV
ncbi:mitochondrial ribosome-associated GTPase 2 isoform X3 [Vicugna pacos]|uniref:Mitochondrial ribosome-associated GTPase 2 isoform X3 n=1 Tax=Vicugna pacos TaxID=30538 RepID=A0ABM5BW70_VICPA